VWFQDESRIGQHGTTTRIWAGKGTRPRVLKQQEFGYTYVFGAVCPSKDKSVGLVISEVGIDAMKEHLKLISSKVDPGSIAIVVLDRASWHTSSKVDIFDNLLLLHLPTGSPELNPTEQVWQQLRNLYLANRVYKSKEEIMDVCVSAWNDYTNQHNRIRQLCSRKWANFAH
jgi:hypothetical protein